MKKLIIILILASVSVFSQEQNRFTEQFKEADSAFVKSMEDRFEAYIDSIQPTRYFGIDSRSLKTLPNANSSYFHNRELLSMADLNYRTTSIHFEGLTIELRGDSIHFDSTTPLAKSTRVFLKYLTDVLDTKIDSLENEIRILKARKEED